MIAFVILLGQGVSLVGGYSELQNLHQGDRPAVVASAATGMASANASVEYQRGTTADFDRQIAAKDRNFGMVIRADAKQKMAKAAARDARKDMGTADRDLADLVQRR
jgi:hypothetical protein